MRKWFSGIRFKLLLVSIIALASLFIVGTVGFFAVSSLGDKLDIAYNERSKMTEYLGDIEKGVHASVRFLLTSQSYDTDLKYRQEYVHKTRKEIQELEEALKNYLALPRLQKAHEIFDKKFAPNWDITKKNFDEAALELEKNDSHATERAKMIIDSKLRVALEPLNEAIDELQSTSQEYNKKIVTEALVYAQNAKTIAIVVVMAGGFLCFVICIFIANQLVKVLSNVSNDLNNSSIQVSAAAEQIASASEQLSQATIEQASSLEETSSSIQEMSSTLTKTSENAIQASRISAESKQSAIKGKEVVQSMIFSINEITVSNNNIMIQINESNKQISEIVQVITEIGNKTNVINDIVFQTKLLSFNASVEAARAGENGKGFAVVAEEVGNLAQMSGKAANEITEMLDGSIKKVENIVSDTKIKVEQLVSEGKIKVEKGTTIARECGEVLEEIVNSISSVNSMANEISVSSKEQSQGVFEITKAMNQINVATQQNSAGATQSASAAEELAAQANSLKSAVHSLVITIEGAA